MLWYFHGHAPLGGLHAALRRRDALCRGDQPARRAPGSPPGGPGRQVHPGSRAFAAAVCRACGRARGRAPPRAVGEGPVPGGQAPAGEARVRRLALALSLLVGAQAWAGPKIVADSDVFPGDDGARPETLDLKLVD